MTAAGAGTRASRGGGLAGASSCEWVKLWSLRSTWWSLAASALLVVAYVLMVGLSASASKANGEIVPAMNPIEVAAGGVFLMGQLGLATLAALAMAGEYATGSILSTLQWVPDRSRMLLAKALVLSPVLLVAGSAVSLLGASAGIPALDQAAGPWDAAGLAGGALAVGAYSAAAGVITLGLAAMLRSVAGTLACAFLLLLVFPMTLQATGIEVLIRIAEYLPSSAGMALVGTEGPAYGATTAGAILVAWAAGAWTAGVTVLRSRDAT